MNDHLQTGLRHALDYLGERYKLHPAHDAYMKRITDTTEIVVPHYLAACGEKITLKMALTRQGEFK
jgi:hypothetical protein